ncbi:MAG: Trk system potassium transporter TrkA [Haloferacaceae archaeon]
MRVVVIGAGLVGSTVAADLNENHDVVVVDRDPDRVDELTYSLDVLAVEGDGTSLGVLEEAGVADADMVIASTNDDETNIVACATAETIGDAFTVARVKNVEYLRTWQRSAGTGPGAFGIDFMVCTDLLTAEAIVRVAGVPAARDVDQFAEGKVEMAELEVPEGSPIADRTVAEADRFASLTFAAVFRDGETLLPDGTTVIEAGDRVLVIGTPASVSEFAGDVAAEGAVEGATGPASEVVVVGGSEIGFHVARLLGDRGFSPRLVERDPERAREIAEDLPETMVMESDATAVEFLEREHVGDADMVVAALDADEKNLLVCLLATRLGVERTVAVIETAAYADLFEAVGVDVAISPREVVAEEITRFAREDRAENVALVGRGEAEVLEIEIDPDSALAGRPIRESVPALSDGVVVGAIIRNDEFVVPRGDTVVEAGDQVVLFVDAAVIDDVSAQL